MVEWGVIGDVGRILTAVGIVGMAVSGLVWVLEKVEERRMKNCEECGRAVCENCGVCHFCEDKEVRKKENEMPISTLETVSSGTARALQMLANQIGGLWGIPLLTLALGIAYIEHAIGEEALARLDPKVRKKLIETLSSSISRGAMESVLKSCKDLGVELKAEAVKEGKEEEVMH